MKKRELWFGLAMIAGGILFLLADTTGRELVSQECGQNCEHR